METAAKPGFSYQNHEIVVVVSSYGARLHALYRKYKEPRKMMVFVVEGNRDLLANIPASKGAEACTHISEHLDSKHLKANVYHVVAHGPFGKPPALPIRDLCFGGCRLERQRWEEASVQCIQYPGASETPTSTLRL